MLEEWLIDGYNLLHALNALSQWRGLSREKFLILLADFAAARDRRVTVVLDGKGNPDEFQAYLTKSFSVLYSQDVSADTCIEKCLYERRKEASFVVVTHDRAIASMARGAGARVMSAGDILELLKTDRKNAEELSFKQDVRAHGFHRPFKDKL